MKRILIFISISLLAGFAAVGAPDTTKTPSPKKQAEPNVVATVNGEPILLKDIESRLGKIHGEAMDSERAGFDLDLLLFKMTNDLLLGQEARALEMDQEPPTNDQIRLFRNDLLLKVLDAEEVVEPSRPTDEEIAERYELLYRRITLRVITKYEQEETGEVIALLEEGADVADVARDHSVDPYALRGGLVDGIARIDLQKDIADFAFEMSPGQVAGPIRTDLGWSVIKVESFEDADPELFDARKRKVSSLVQYEKATELRSKLTIETKANHPVKIDQKAVEAVKPKRLPDARLTPDYPDPDAVVVRIGESRTITAEEYGRALLTRWSGVRNEEAAVAAAPIILQKTIDKELLLAEAEDRGYSDRPKFKHAVNNRETELLIPRYLDQVVAPRVKVTEEDLKQYFADHVDEFHKLPRVRLGQITVATEETALRLADQLRDGADLAWLVKQHSIDRYKEAGGDRGWMTPNPGLDRIHDQLLEAPKGTILDPFGVTDNWQVLMVTGREEQGLYTFDEISGNIRKKVLKDKFVVVLDEFMKKLRERAEITVNKDVLATLNISGTMEAAAGEEGEHGAHGH
ncbi:MAG: peptidyl-prolyl cis-trans isomerase [Acidobacteria bacterium]|uniref:Peptidyl-prolyl cis-trans isomerase n=1 Tax=Candidatus Polarisedimenticola svalbardensis TaxID=2886004 RepID=A0A8J6Y0F2_9BACT|nr:peptidyl-prolyl cis-trans isomerase [Candidatus Polarisedimenticola svalbardensis]